jgi:hypothetical protein
MQRAPKTTKKIDFRSHFFAQNILCENFGVGSQYF